MFSVASHAVALCVYVLAVSWPLDTDARLLPLSIPRGVGAPHRRNQDDLRSDLLATGRVLHNLGTCCDPPCYFRFARARRSSGVHVRISTRPRMHVAHEQCNLACDQCALTTATARYAFAHSLFHTLLAHYN